MLLLLPYLSLGSYNQKSAEDYLKNNPQNPWSTMALATLGASAIPTDHLKNLSAATAVELEAPILAITSLGYDPRTFANRDYVAALKGFYQNGQIGDPNALNDDIFGILALISAGVSEKDEIISGAKAFLLASQNEDGGWGFAPTGGSDTNMTAAAILALIAAATPKSHPAVEQAVSYLKSAQNEDGGFPYDPQSQFGTASDSSSTAWVIWALNALGIDPASWTKEEGNPVSYLQSLQNQNGYFGFMEAEEEENSFSPITTSYAVIALAGKSLPLNTVTPSFPFRIEGSQDSVCQGFAAGPTALDIIRNASQTCGFSYTITDTDFGPYLSQINEDKAEGLSGWLYFVNNTSPNTGAGDYLLTTGDEVLWYYGEWGWQPTRLSLSQQEIASDQDVRALVEYFDGKNWQPLAGASIIFGSKSAVTDSAGIATISPNDGFYKIYAEKEGFVRSNIATLTAGSAPDSNVNLSLTLENGTVAGENTGPEDENEETESVSFVINPAVVDFGVIKPGEKASEKLNILNTGSADLYLETVVSGDEIFRNFLKISGRHWQKFQADLPHGNGQDYTLEISLPSNLTAPSGNKTGQITFWATAN